jgi:hypothetical protein
MVTTKRLLHRLLYATFPDLRAEGLDAHTWLAFLLADRTVWCLSKRNPIVAYRESQISGMVPLHSFHYASRIGVTHFVFSLKGRLARSRAKGKPA